MNRNEIRLACLMIGSFAILCRADVPTAEQSSTENPYKTIVERNPFGLKPPPPPAPPPPPVVDQTKNDLKLTGITSFGSLKAYFAASDPKTKAPEYFSLGVDEKKDGIEVLAIDDSAKSVRIRNAGAETLMTFNTHGVTPPTTPPPPLAPGPGVPGGMPLPGGGMNNMPVTTGMSPMSPSNPGITTIPSRTPRLQTAPGQNNPGGYRFSGAPVSNLPPQPTPQNKLSSEEQAILMEIQRMGNPGLPPTPGLPTTTTTGPSFPGGIPAPGGPAAGIPRVPRLPGQ